MPLLVQTGNVKSMDCREFPSARNVRELLGRVAAFHREESPAADTQMPGPLHERLDRTDCARHDAVETLFRPIGFRARVYRLHVVQAERLRCVLDELELLRSRVD